MFWGLGLWLAARDPRLCRVAEELPAEDGSRRACSPGRRCAAADGGHAGILDSGGIAILTATPAVTAARARLELSVAGFGPHGPELAADLAAHVQAWDRAGQPAAGRLRVDAYPRASADEPDLPASGELVIERADTRFVVSHT